MDDGGKDGSVDEFLERIRELGVQRDKEDEERARRLEEEIQAGKLARQARRAERARSLSPDKDTPPVTPNSKGIGMGNRTLVDSPALTPSTKRESLLSREDSVNEALSKLSGKPLNLDFDFETLVKGSPSPTKIAEESSSLSASSPAPAAASTPTSSSIDVPPVRLSWQRRPAQKRERPMTMYASRPPVLEESSATSKDDQDTGRARSNTVKNLGSRDIDIFKQTEDKQASILDNNKEETIEAREKAVSNPSFVSATSAHESHANELVSCVSSAQHDEEQSYGARKLTSAALSSFDEGFTVRGRANSVRSVGSNNLLADNLVLSPGHGYTGSPTAGQGGRLSPERRERTPSPTKGLGGFVQSAMLKREGSINKRWSQAPPALSRNGSTASARPISLYGTRPIALEKSHSTLSEPAPLQDQDSAATTALEDLPTPQKESSSSPSPKRTESPTRSNSILSTHTRTYSLDPSGTPSSPPIPISPSKTYDQKRWSPTKSSWLESALKKTSEPAIKPAFIEPKPPSPERKPAAFNISFVKPRSIGDNRPIVPPASGSAFVPNPALSPPPAFAQPRRSESPEARKPISIERKPESRLLPEIKPREPEVKDEPAKTEESTADSKSDMPAEAVVAEQPAPAAEKPLGRLPSVATKPPVAPKPGVIDFRANLKPRQNSTAGDQPKDLEFLNAISKLRPSKTQNFVPKDQLKETILSGKASLQHTGGPKPRERVDPLKESILSAKEAIKAKAGDKPVGSLVGRSDSVKPVNSSPVVGRLNLNRPRAGTSFSPASSETSDSKTDTQPGVGKFALRPRAGTAASTSPSSEQSKPESFGTSATRARSTTRSSPSPPPAGSSPPRKLDSPAAARINLGRNSPPQKSESPPPAARSSFSSSTKPAIASLKDRMNPNLAALLSRGPPGKAPGSGSGGIGGGSSGSGDAEEEGGKKKELTHLTKGRARGPKRRGPGNVAGATKTKTATATSPAATAAVEKSLPAETAEPSTTTISSSPIAVDSKQNAQTGTSTFHKIAVGVEDIKAETKSPVFEQESSIRKSVPPPVKAEKKAEVVNRVLSVGSRKEVEVGVGGYKAGKENGVGEEKKAGAPEVKEKKVDLLLKKDEAAATAKQEKTVKEIIKTASSPIVSPKAAKVEKVVESPKPAVPVKTVTAIAAVATASPSPVTSPIIAAKVAAESPKSVPPSPVTSPVSKPVASAESPRTVVKPMLPSGSFKPQPSPKPEKLAEVSSPVSVASPADSFKAKLSLSLEKKPASPRDSLKSSAVRSPSESYLPSPPRSGGIALPGMATALNSALASVSSSAQVSPAPLAEKNWPETPVKKPSLSARNSYQDLSIKPVSPISPASSLKTSENTIPSPIIGADSPTIGRAASFGSLQAMVIKEEEAPPPPPRKDSLPLLSRSPLPSPQQLPVTPKKPSTLSPDFTAKPGSLSPALSPVTPPKPLSLNKPLPSAAPDRPLPTTPTKQQQSSLSPLPSPAPTNLSTPATPIKPDRNARTHKFTVTEITSDGKHLSLPLNKEHIFHDESMYLCTHVYTLPNSPSDQKYTELYLWTGDRVPPGHAEDVQLFARQHARSHEARLIKVQQAREPLAFLQAIGWIFIILRGRAPTSSSPPLLLPFMLRGEHVQGAIVFHEVDLVRKMLDSNCVFLVCNGKKLWLWKGKMVKVEDVGVARLVGFDLGGGREVEEVEEGGEGRGFWEAVA